LEFIGILISIYDSTLIISNFSWFVGTWPTSITTRSNRCSKTSSKT